MPTELLFERETMKYKKSILVTAAIVVWTIVALMLTGCRTVQGLGQDLELAAKSLEDYAVRKNY